MAPGPDSTAATAAGSPAPAGTAASSAPAGTPASSAPAGTPASSAPAGTAASGTAGGKPARRRNAAQTRQALLEAASARFARDGYGHTTVRDIADEAGVNVALISRYFSSKEGLFEACLTAAVTDLRRDADDTTLEAIGPAMAHRIAGSSPDSPPPDALLLLLRTSGDARADAIRRDFIHAISERMAAAAAGTATPRPTPNTGAAAPSEGPPRAGTAAAPEARPDVASGAETDAAPEARPDGPPGAGTATAGAGTDAAPGAGTDVPGRVLRAQIVLAAALGMTLLRSTVSVEPLATATEEDLREPLSDLVNALLAPDRP
ncbi:TetR/AcrR family transcriptional regulator [Couchioplanes caeruleus]|uniref:TetR/AcrR family transcriptional regulator n=1 Tax=Couchioplanes caeruleus TaxID=56438 RepID=UPI0023E043B8|nr:TetR family transcriptional regulator [Couchioplanes caeruleus]